MKNFFSKKARYWTERIKVIESLINSNKYKIKNDKIITDITSPTGKSYLGVSKNPLSKVKRGFGYYGVLLQTDNREFIQCHVCGKWLRVIRKNHLKTHKLTTREYKEKFGLYLDKGLIADGLSYRLEESSRNIFYKYKDQILVNLKKANKAANLTHKKLIGLAEHENKYNLCEKQLGFRLLEYIKKYKILPSRSQKGEGSRIAKALCRRYENLNKGFEHYKLPVYFRTGTTMRMIASNTQEIKFNYNRNYNRDHVYDWMVKNTPSLSRPNKFKE